MALEQFKMPSIEDSKYNKMKLSQLRKIVRERNLKFEPGMNKEDVIELLEINDLEQKYKPH